MSSFVENRQKKKPILSKLCDRGHDLFLGMHMWMATLSSQIVSGSLSPLPKRANWQTNAICCALGKSERHNSLRILTLVHFFNKHNCSLQLRIVHKKPYLHQSPFIPSLSTHVTDVCISALPDCFSSFPFMSAWPRASCSIAPLLPF